MVLHDSKVSKWVCTGVVADGVIPHLVVIHGLETIDVIVEAYDGDGMRVEIGIQVLTKERIRVTPPASYLGEQLRVVVMG